MTYLPLSSYHLPGDSSSSEESGEEEEVKPKPPPAKKKKDTGSQDHKKTGTSNNELKVRRVRHVFFCSRLSSPGISENFDFILLFVLQF